MCFNYEKNRKKVLLAAVAMLSGIGAFAQGNGSAGINEATQMVTLFRPRNPINLRHRCGRRANRGR
jgi:hypothetical protein